MSEFDDTKGSNSKKVKKKFNKTIKKAYLEYIVKGIKQHKRYSKIVEDVLQRFGAEFILKNTIQKWVSALKSPRRNVAERQLGSRWIQFWEELHPESDDESNQEEPRRRESIQSTMSFTARLESNTEETGSLMTDEGNDDELPDIIEIKQESAEEFPRVPSKTSRANFMEPDSTTRNSKRKPRRILGKANLKGQTYFMVKWKGSYENELGMP